MHVISVAACPTYAEKARRWVMLHERGEDHERGDLTGEVCNFASCIRRHAGLLAYNIEAGSLLCIKDNTVIR
jgi:hypothetical protein